MTNPLIGKIALALRSAIGAFRNAWADPNVKDASEIDVHRARCQFLWSWYTNSVFDTILSMAGYRQYYNLYRNTRSIINPVARVVDFYAGHVYPGTLTIDPTDLPDGTQAAIPFSRNTEDVIQEAIAEWWHTTNWQVNKNTMVRFGAIAGDVLVVLADEVTEGRVTAEVVWTGQLAGIEVDTTGAVQMYHREYTVRDDLGRSYVYGKKVTPTEITTYKDGREFGYDGEDAVIPNPYGFVPAVWAKHKDVGGTFGEPATAGVHAKLDEGNQYVSMLVDRSRKVVESPVIITAPNAIGALNQKAPAATMGALDPSQDTKSDDRDVIRTLRLPKDTKIESIPMDLANALAVFGVLVQQIEDDLPELVMYRELRAMSQVTGPAAERLIGDVTMRVYEAAANYDRASESLFSMALAISGWRANSGAWGPVSTLTERQRLFLPFDLEFYTDDVRDFQILPRPLIPPLRSERIADALLERQAGVDDRYVLELLGHSDEQIARFEAARQAERASRETDIERLFRGG